MVINTDKAPIHIWLYNHPLQYVSDQIDFLFLLMRQHGYPITMGRSPRNDALNVVIENFSETTSRTLIDYCEQQGKRVALIMTEHLDLIGNELFIHGDRLWSDNDYMHPATQVARIKNLMDCVPYLRAIFVLGDLPELKGSERMFPGLAVRTLPFPELLHQDLSRQAPEHDLVFSGALTTFREEVLQSIGRGFSLVHTKQFLSRKGRDQLNSSARVALNIPQRPGWRWLSLMRVIAALRCGRATVSIGTVDTSRISSCCVQLAANDWQQSLATSVENWRQAYEDSLAGYEAMRRDFLQLHAFPHDLLEYWGLLERVHGTHDTPDIAVAEW